MALIFYSFEMSGNLSCPFFYTCPHIFPIDFHWNINNSANYTIKSINLSLQKHEP